MEERYTLELTPMQIAFIRQSLDIVTISGKDTKFLNNLQLEIENKMKDIDISKNPPTYSVEKK
jgi:hypothetical protein